MAKQPSEKSGFKSRFASDTWITPGQFLAENMCARQAKRDRAELGDRFWESDKWKKEFVLQTVHAASLLKVFSITAVIAALRTVRGQKVFSLGLKSVIIPLAKFEQERIDNKIKAVEAQAALKPEAEPQPAELKPETPRPAFVPNKSTLSKLRDL